MTLPLCRAAAQAPPPPRWRGCLDIGMCAIFRLWSGAVTAETTPRMAGQCCFMCCLGFFSVIHPWRRPWRLSFPWPMTGVTPRGAVCCGFLARAARVAEATRPSSCSSYPFFVVLVLGGGCLRSLWRKRSAWGLVDRRARLSQYANATPNIAGADGGVGDVPLLVFALKFWSGCVFFFL